MEPIGAASAARAPVRAISRPMGAVPLKARSPVESCDTERSRPEGPGHKRGAGVGPEHAHGAVKSADTGMAGRPRPGWTSA